MTMQSDLRNETLPASPEPKDMTKNIMGIRVDTTLNLASLVFAASMLFTGGILYSQMSSNITNLINHDNATQAALVIVTRNQQSEGDRLSNLESRDTNIEASIDAHTTRRDGQIQSLQDRTGTLATSAAATTATLGVLSDSVNRILALLEAAGFQRK